MAVVGETPFQRGDVVWHEAPFKEDSRRPFVVVSDDSRPFHGEEYTVVVVTHNMQQASRISDQTAVFLTGGELVEYDATGKIFENPESQRVEDYITGKFG